MSCVLLKAMIQAGFPRTLPSMVVVGLALARV